MWCGAAAARVSLCCRAPRGGREPVSPRVARAMQDGRALTVRCLMPANPGGAQAASSRGRSAGPVRDRPLSVRPVSLVGLTGLGRDFCRCRTAAFPARMDAPCAAVPPAGLRSRWWASTSRPCGLRPVNRRGAGKSSTRGRSTPRRGGGHRLPAVCPACRSGNDEGPERRQRSGPSCFNLGRMYHAPPRVFAAFLSARRRHHSPTSASE